MQAASRTPPRHYIACLRFMVHFRWMGSVQLALPYLLGVPMGKLFDAGYIHSVLAAGSALFVFSCVQSVLRLRFSSHHCVRLFMVSLAKPDQYYQVRVLIFAFIQVTGVDETSLASLESRDRNGIGCRMRSATLNHDR